MNAHAAYWDEIFERIHASFPKFVAPTGEVRSDWVTHLREFTRTEIFAGVTMLAGERSVRPTIPTLRGACERVRDSAEELQRKHAEQNGSASTTQQKGVDPEYCQRCRSHTPVVQITRRPDDSVFARLSRCRCVPPVTEKYTVIVTYKEFAAAGLRLDGIDEARLPFEWVPQKHGESNS